MLERRWSSGHPHVTCCTEYYRGRLIVYSLGNLPRRVRLIEAERGWLLRLTPDRDGLVRWETLAAQMDDEWRATRAGGEDPLRRPRRCAPWAGPLCANP